MYRATKDRMGKKRERRKISNMDWMHIRTMETTSFLSKAHNCKSPGSDQIRNYWLKAFPAAHWHITKKLQHNNGGTREDT
jgi:hypothetical protein